MKPTLESYDKPFSFSGHETFPFRLGWLWKGVRAVDTDPGIFSADNAIISLGVGKNMVRSIRHWCLTFDLIQETTRGKYEPTPWGKALFIEDGGLDPYLEKPGTLWWLHWTLANNSERATTWYYVFNRLPRNEFTRLSLRDALLQLVAGSPRRPPSVSSIVRDVECMIRTYWTSRRQLTEESIECPLIELNLIRGTPDRFRLLRGPQPSLPDLVFVAALADYHKRSWSSSATIPVDYILFDEHSPGRVFLLDEHSLLERLSRLEAITNGAMTYDSTAGLRQVLIHGATLERNLLLRRYYRRA